MLRIHTVPPLFVLRLTLAGVVVLSLWSSTTHAQTGRSQSALPPTDAEQTEARTRYTRGLQLVKEENYQAALIEMQRAYSLNPSYKILYNLGQIQSHLGDAAAAVESYQRYLSDGGSDIPPGRILEVSQEIARLHTRVGSVELTVKGEGATVLVDEAVVGLSPFKKKVLVNVGKHKFTAARSGAEPMVRIVPIAGEDAITLELDASIRAEGLRTRQAAQQPAAEASAPDVKREESTLPRRAVAVDVEDQTSKTGHEVRSGNWLLWAGWAATGALAVGTVVTAFIARGDAQDLSRMRGNPNATRTSLDNAEASTFRAALITDILLGASVLAAGTSLYLTLVPGRSSEAAGTASRDGLLLTLSPCGASLHGSF